MHEVLVFTPVDGQFDVAKVEGFLASLPFTFRDSDGVWLLCGNAGATHYSRMHLARNQPGYPYMCLVTPRPESIQIAQTCDEDALLQAREVAEWIHATYRCKIAGSEGQDLTSQAAESVALLYET